VAKTIRRMTRRKTSERRETRNNCEVTPQTIWPIAKSLMKKLKLSLCFNWAPRHEGVLGEWKYSSTHSLTSALDGDEWSASHPGRFTPRERAPGTHWIGGWVGPRAVLDAVVKRKILSPRRESNPRTPIVQPVAQDGQKSPSAIHGPLGLKFSPYKKPKRLPTLWKISSQHMTCVTGTKNGG
jgi:hypothetical protein